MSRFRASAGAFADTPGGRGPLDRSQSVAGCAAYAAAGLPTRPAAMAKKFPLHPAHPERICWGCDKYCPADSLACGNGSGRTLHPAEMLGDDWYTYGDWGLDVDTPPASSKP